MHNWYVLQVLSTHEKKVKKAIEEQRDLKGMTDFIDSVVLPTENVSEVKKGQQKVVEKRLWPGLADLQKVKLDPDGIDVQELKDRLLGIQALETARCFEEKVLTDVREADVGSILGFGFAPFSGGTLSWIDMMGTKRFVALCRNLEKKYGERFTPNKLLIDLAEHDEGFYQRFAPAKRKEAA